MNTSQQHGWECSGIEPRKDSVDTALDKYGLHLLPCGFEELDKQRGYHGRFPLVTMNRVLEHIYPMELLFSQVRSILQPHAYLYIEVPSLEMIAAHEVESDIMSFVHLCHFTARSLERLLGQNGFRAISVEPCFEDGFAVIRSLFRKEALYNLAGRHAVKAPKEDIEYVKSCFLKHVARREERKSLVIEKIEALLQHSRPVVFYGAGEDMCDLMISARCLLSRRP